MQILSVCLFFAPSNHLRVQADLQISQAEDENQAKSLASIGSDSHQEHGGQHYRVKVRDNAQTTCGFRSSNDDVVADALVRVCPRPGVVMLHPDSFDRIAVDEH